jgi:hypothetical protein
VAVALGNWGSPEAVPVLATALHDDEPLVRGHAAWALGRIGTEAALEEVWPVGLRGWSASRTRPQSMPPEVRERERWSLPVSSS